MAEPAFRSWLPAAEKLRFLAAGGSTTVFSYVLYAGLLYLEMAPVRAYLAGLFPKEFAGRIRPANGNAAA